MFAPQSACLVTSDRIDDLALQYKQTDCLVLPASHRLSRSIDWREVENNVLKVSIDNLVDTPGHAYYDQCELAVGDAQQRIVALTLNPLLPEIERIVASSPLNAIRSKVNAFTAGQFIRTHVDQADYSRGLVSVGLHLDRSYTGGEFEMAPLGEVSRKFKIESHSIVLWGMKVPHGVEKVTSGQRVTIVHFLGN